MKDDLKKKKERYLSSLSGNKNKYKRSRTAPIRYAGGKSLAVGHIIEMLPNNIKKVISPFIGGGSVEVAVSRELDIEVVGYDIFDVLVNFWNVLINGREDLYKELKKLKPNKEEYEKVKGKLKAHWKKEKLIKDKVKLAAYYYFNHNLSYGPGFLGWPSSVYLNKKRYERMVGKLKDFDPKNLKVKCGDFEEAFKKYPNDFFYCDPPYFIGNDSKMFRGIYPMRNIPVHHNGFNHEKLKKLLDNHKGGFILSYNNCDDIRRMYKKYKQTFPKWQYTMGQGETRIGKNRIEKRSSHVKESHEILIYCPPKN
jgi:DNA adenine methylase